MYNRGVRLYKNMYEVLMRILLNKMESEEEYTSLPEQLTNIDLSCTADNAKELIDSEPVSILYNKFSNFRSKLKEESNRYSLSCFSISFIEMVELLLQTIYSIRSGNWELFIECIREIIPYTFAYDNLNYARYLSAMLGDMLSLPTDFPEIYEEFVRGNFAAQLSYNKFSRSETDKVIEMTLNKDTKTPGGVTGFSTNDNAVKQWELNAAYRASLRKCFHEHLHYKLQKYAHPDLTPSRIKKDEADVQMLMRTLTTLFIDPFSDQPLLSISTGVLASEAVCKDMKSAKEQGKKSMDLFKDERLSRDPTKSFFDPIQYDSNDDEEN